MKNFTLQRNLGKYSERWGCYSTSIINIVENEIGRKLTDIELSTVIGVWFRSQSIFLANYHNHKAPLDRSYIGSPNQWTSKNDSAWHFLIDNPENALEDVFYSIKKTPTKKKGPYEIRMYYLSSGSHFCSCIKGQVVNPDPSINITGIKFDTILKF